MDNGKLVCAKCNTLIEKDIPCKVCEENRNNGNGDRNKPTEEELKKQLEEKIQQNTQNFKDLVTDKVLLVVRVNEDGQYQWLTTLNPADLNLFLDRIKFNLVNPKPKENIIQKPNTIIGNLKGAFGKKRF